MRPTIDNNSDALQYVSNGSNIPRPPRKGEVMICQMCGQPMLPEHFSKDITTRKREFKWHIHAACFNHMENLADQGVPGLLTERKQKENKL